MGGIPISYFHDMVTELKMSLEYTYDDSWYGNVVYRGYSYRFPEGNVTLAVVPYHSYYFMPPSYINFFSGGRFYRPGPISPREAAEILLDHKIPIYNYLDFFNSDVYVDGDI